MLPIAKEFIVRDNLKKSIGEAREASELRTYSIEGSLIYIDRFIRGAEKVCHDLVELLKQDDYRQTAVDNLVSKAEAWINELAKLVSMLNAGEQDFIKLQYLANRIAQDHDDIMPNT